MLVTITNIDPTLREVYIPGPDITIQPALSATISRTWAELDSDRILKNMVMAGTVSLAFTKEVGDDAALQPDASVKSYINANRPAPALVPVFTPVWNLTNNNLNWSDGVAWRDAAGVIVP